jgi:hypothetical protein
MVQLIDTKIAHGFDAGAEDLGRDADGEAIYQPAAKKRCYELSPSLHHHRAHAPRAKLDQQGAQLYLAFSIVR